MSKLEFIEVAGRKIATLTRPGQGAAQGQEQGLGLVWLGGFRSEMTATKATHLDETARRHGLDFTRFDYSGHGQSEGDFATTNLSCWLADTLAVLRQKTSGPQLLIGSSMGGWIALRAIEDLIKTGEADRIAGLILIAPAPDFTERLMWASFPPHIRHDILTHGFWLRPSPYSPEPYPITRDLIEDGRKHLVLHRGLDLACPVHIVHGTADPDVPYELSIELMGRLRGASVSLTLIKNGDHRLSAPSELAALDGVLMHMLTQLLPKISV